MTHLKLIGTIESPHTQSELEDLFVHNQWRKLDSHPNQFASGHIRIRLEGDEFTLLHGDLTGLDDLHAITQCLSQTDASYSLDVFEEDGRLVKRLQG